MSSSRNFMQRKEKFVIGEYYHVYSRTILSLPEFKDNRNASRLAKAFLAANSTESAVAFKYLRNNQRPTFKKLAEIAKKGDKLVDILCYVIMPNHYHLLLRERVENGITDFVRKSNTSIAKYINIKKDRKGPLFESRFLSKHIDSNEYLLHLSLYIHLNPLDFIDNKNWRKGNLKKWNIKKGQLMDYPWSSLKYFLKYRSVDFVVSGTKIIEDQFDNNVEYEKFLRDWSENDLQKLIGVGVFVN